MYTILLSALLLLSGCSTLVIQDHDTPLTVTGKIAARVPFAILSVGTSEIIIRQEAERLAYIEWYQSLSEHDQDREDRRRHHSAPLFIISPQPYQFYQLPIR